jgi:hypothetical protein
MAREVMINYEGGASPNTVWIGNAELDGETVYIMKWTSGKLKPNEFFKVLSEQQYKALNDAKDVRSIASKVNFS